ncbi:hypothetical protein L1987_22368 [Smallanthus sonchifolius]|uniref:Uncharacterized protein n=1 Tax=Smallanthus sonchifolius TaxID=185202 RepID=A0ACB9IG50_9ASTR|nr:hypothetical protein L1987_22368 [Smallanthus sonchifolius]
MLSGPLFHDSIRCRVSWLLRHNLLHVFVQVFRVPSKAFLIYNLGYQTILEMARMGAVNFALMVSQMEGGCPVDYNTNIPFALDKGFYGVHKFLLVSMIKLIKFLHRDSIILLLFCGHGNHQGKNGYPNNGRGGGCGGNVGYRVKI